MLGLKFHCFFFYTQRTIFLQQCINKWMDAWHHGFVARSWRESNSHNPSRCLSGLRGHNSKPRGCQLSRHAKTRKTRRTLQPKILCLLAIVTSDFQRMARYSRAVRVQWSFTVMHCPHLDLVDDWNCSSTSRPLRSVWFAYRRNLNVVGTCSSLMMRIQDCLHQQSFMLTLPCTLARALRRKFVNLISLTSLLF